tara:strand:+ start:935 stop:1225 length:291 start_codon:yes stop_codon:yes gene_type:complete
MVEAFLIGITVAAIPSYWFKKKIYIDENEILISNNLLGIEKVYINEEVVISKFAWAGTYQFKMEEVEYEVSFFFKALFLSVGIELKRGNKVLYSER